MIESTHFGEYGGCFVPETLMAALEELESGFRTIVPGSEFQGEMNYYLHEYAGRMTPLTYCRNVSRDLGCRVYLKREDLLHSGAHKLNNALGQALLAKLMGKSRLIAETGAGQHGVATAIAGAALGMRVEVYMGEEDISRQALNVTRMRMLGATVIPVKSGSRTLKDAINEALRDWVANVRDTHYLIGSVVGPHPFPTLVRDFQTVIGRETRAQILEKEERLPDAIVACVGGGSNANAIAPARLIANPGCYPTSVTLALLPLIRAGLLEIGSDIISDSKSGATGAGRGVKPEMMFSEVAANFRPYNPILHRHAPEMCQEIGWDLNNFTFVPHLLPINRGILSTMYVRFHQPVSAAQIEAEYERRYSKHPFVRILGGQRLPELRAVQHTNFCDIGFRLTDKGRRGVIFSAIDNLVKGASGQAVQNFNLMHGLDEHTGLL